MMVVMTTWHVLAHSNGSRQGSHLCKPTSSPSTSPEKPQQTSCTCTPKLSAHA